MKIVIMLKRIKAWLCKKSIVDKKMLNSKRKYNFNIYGQTTEQEFAKTFNAVHHWFKVKLVMPVLVLVDYIFNKYDETKYLELPQNINLKIFNKSFDETIQVWVREFLSAVYSNDPNSTFDIEKTLKSSHSVKSLRILKKAFLMTCQTDTAYLEFYNILSHKISKNMCEHYKNKSNNHLFYTSKSIGDFKYFAILNKFQGDDSNGKPKQEEINKERKN